MSNVIKKEDSLCGITYWVQFYQQRVPFREVFKYVGRQPDKGLYYFQSVTEKCIISKSFYQLNANGFRPFLLDTAKIHAYQTEQNHHALV